MSDIAFDPYSDSISPSSVPAVNDDLQNDSPDATYSNKQQDITNQNKNKTIAELIIVAFIICIFAVLIHVYRVYHKKETNKLIRDDEYSTGIELNSHELPDMLPPYEAEEANNDAEEEARKIAAQSNPFADPIPLNRPSPAYLKAKNSF
ncbi:hypothetical protein CANARDRAFT_21190 [[Candida] arabinofermentans NRRL YB-2248]|uniref:Uncharacterized protein n=1 Tax=[Candida] arabinofermentans NRRL YB-2248 TaxID=983967 RepID=A0A1E4T633_9ASCO|nr:hypothetical protein CANARDRAFT_21190 [[Candida] arabinofermentans NRRL YB-2248]